MSPFVENPVTNGHATPANSQGITNGSTTPKAASATTSKSPSNPTLSSFIPNPALHTSPDHSLSLSPSPALTPLETDCIIHITCSGICGSDLHLWHTGHIGSLHVTAPHCLGHESAGRIVWLGSACPPHLKLGMRVAIEPGVPCASTACHWCSTGEYNLCPDVQFAGVPPYSGAIRRWHVHRGAYLHPIPDALTWGQAALLEPLSVVLHGLERSQVRLGEGVLVAGAGPIGLLCAAAARASGCWPIVVTDVEETRLEFARGFVEGCRTVKVGLGEGEEVVAGEIEMRFKEVGAPMPRVSFECTGVAGSVRTCILATRRGGEVMVIGVGRDVMDGLPFMHASMGEIDLKFINRYHHSWPYAIRLAQSGYIDLEPLVTHKFKLEDAVKAMETVSDRSSGAVKVHIVDDEDVVEGNGQQ